MAPLVDEKHGSKPLTKDAALAAAEADARAAGGTERTLGVYKMYMAPKPSVSLTAPLGKQVAQLRAVIDALPHVRRFLGDVLLLDPVLVASVWALEFAQAVIPGVRMYLTNWLLGTVERGISTGKMDVASVQLALVVNVAFTLISAVIDRMNERLSPLLQDRVQLHFEYLSMEASLSKSFADFESEGGPDESYHNPFGGGRVDAWPTFQSLRQFLTNVTSIGAQLTALLRIAQENRVGPVFMAVWVIRLLPIFDNDMSFFRGCVYYAYNAAYLRMSALKQMVNSKEHRQEIISGGLGPYILQEYEAARAQLGMISTAHPYHLAQAETNPLVSLLKKLIDDFPTIYYAGYAARTGAVPFQFAAVSSIQNASWTVQWQLQSLFGGGERSLPAIVVKIRDMYAALEVRPDPTVEGLEYPAADSSEKGMAIELRDVTFSYPGSQSTKPALRNVSCTIGAGQLVVIVGENGSGKSTFVKLLTRLHNPASGSIFIDGRQADAYRVRGLRAATALLSQDHTLFPSPVGENISLGRPNADVSQAEIEDAARRGGAHGFITKLAKGYDTVLAPVATKGQVGVPMSSPLMKVLEKLEKRTDVSGGERQRLVAARTFLRITDDRVKFVVVDEPSAAMDPTGEFELFRNLREARVGRTMIFITHRFGHLTKHADVILCMKEGELVEVGTHHELLAKKGEYANLYQIQAQAFTA